MVISEFRTKIRGWSKRTERTDAEIDDLTNMAMHLLEDEYNFRRMKKQTTGNLTSAIDYIAIPSDYKCVNSLWITVNSYKEQELDKIDYKVLIGNNPYGNNYQTIPVEFATDEANSKFYTRPFPDDTYPYTFNYYGYSTDLSDSNTSNFWLTTNLWDLLLFRTLMLMDAFGKNLPDATSNDIGAWKSFYDERLLAAKKAEIDEWKKGSYRARKPSVVI